MLCLLIENSRLPPKDTRPATTYDLRTQTKNFIQGLDFSHHRPLINNRIFRLKRAYAAGMILTPLPHPKPGEMTVLSRLWVDPVNHRVYFIG
ncbi:MAG: hypothetical protein KatS3mg045_1210 [Bellilinea sp.]|nr:MAG: hypothetical protein KatS3mg045_1210 [Bellilinea sp.]